MSEEQPYILVEVKTTIRKFNPNYGMDRICVCGHPYHRHFDGYNDVADQDVGCKYCGCWNFKEKTDKSE